MSAEDRVRMGKQAQLIRNDQVFMRAHNMATTDAMVDFANSKIDERDTRERAWAVVQGVQAVLDALDKFIQDATVIELQATGKADAKAKPKGKK